MSEAQRKEVFDNCVYDSCNLNNYEDIVCRHAKSLARICTDQYNLKISWRSANFCRKYDIVYSIRVKEALHMH